MYSKITNPETGRKISINGKLGKTILRNYINVLQGGDLTTKKSRKKIQKRKKNILIKGGALALGPITSSALGSYNTLPSNTDWDMTPPMTGGPSRAYNPYATGDDISPFAPTDALNVKEQTAKYEKWKKAEELDSAVYEKTQLKKEWDATNSAMRDILENEAIFKEFKEAFPSVYKKTHLSKKEHVKLQRWGARIRLREEMIDKLDNVDWNSATPEERYAIQRNPAPALFRQSDPEEYKFDTVDRSFVLDPNRYYEKFRDAPIEELIKVKEWFEFRDSILKLGPSRGQVVNHIPGTGPEGLVYHDTSTRGARKREGARVQKVLNQDKMKHAIALKKQNAHDRIKVYLSTGDNRITKWENMPVGRNKNKERINIFRGVRAKPPTLENPYGTPELPAYHSDKLPKDLKKQLAIIKKYDSPEAENQYLEKMEKLQQRLNP